MSCIAVTSQSLFFMQGVESFIKQRGAFCNSKKKRKTFNPYWKQCCTLFCEHLNEFTQNSNDVSITPRHEEGN